MKKAWLTLETGESFEGTRFGADKDASGELVFTTVSAGYCETLTDPRSAGSVVLFTFPLLGNYGVPEGDAPDGECRAAGVVAREVCDKPSNFRSRETLDAYLKRNGVPGICGIDTRRLTQLIRERGSVRAVISGSEAAKPSADAAEDMALECSCKSPYSLGEGREAAVLDLGAGKKAAELLAAAGFHATVFPCGAPAGAILGGGFGCAVISAGPGAPDFSPERIETVKRLMGRLPVMGLGLGHQLMALAEGGTCKRLPFGHHGASCPVKELSTGRVLMTEQNHMWAVETGSVPGASETYVNLTDGSCEGLVFPEKRAFSMQFYPDGHGGQEYSFGRLAAMMGGND